MGQSCDSSFESPLAARALIERHLERLLASDAFDASERNRRFLRFIVEETINGRSDRLKGYTIALAVFDRDSEFDPQTDPVVRIEAGRLRRSLERYYLTEGARSEIRIMIPKGRYIPEFERLKPVFDLARRQGGEPDPVEMFARIRVFPIDTLSRSKEQEVVAAVLMDEIVVGLSKLFSVSIAHDGLLAMLQTHNNDVLGHRHTHDYMLKSSVHFFTDFLRYVGYLIDRETGDVVWDRSIDIETDGGEFTTVPEQISDAVIDGIRAAGARISTKTIQAQQSTPLTNKL
jgi:TolB-like protein